MLLLNAQLIISEMYYLFASFSFSNIQIMFSTLFKWYLIRIEIMQIKIIYLLYTPFLLFSSQFNVLINQIMAKSSSVTQNR